MEFTMSITLHTLYVGILVIASAMAPAPAAEAPETPEKAGANVQHVQRASVDEASLASVVHSFMAEETMAEAPAASTFTEIDLGSLDLLWPVETRTISSAWGPRVRMMTTVVKTPAGSRRVSKPYTSSHKGIDFTAPLGHGVFAALDGRVSKACRGGKLGNFVVIDHGSGVETVYGHNSANLVKVGDTVLRGQIIARVGNTGHSTGPHVHFEVRIDGRQVNPMPLLNDTEAISAEMSEHNERFLGRSKNAG
jgi:murein DD-endopeptidase MepM/ murein hydrolase activator NlpD